MKGILDQQRRRIGLLGLASCFSAVTCSAFAQTQSQSTYPNRTIRYIVPYPPGGPLDQIARALAEKLKDALGQPVIVENRPGAGGNLGVDLVAKSPPDGYTLVMGAVATHAINPSLFTRLPYDPQKDFAPITRIASVPNVLVMPTEHAQRLGIRSVADLIAYARAHPGKLNFGSGGNGSAGHLAGELLKVTTATYMTHIPYQGAVPAQVGLLGGQTDWMFDNLASAANLIRSGRLKAFAVTTRERSDAFPEIPTMIEAGIKEFDINTWFGVFAPAKTPTEIVTRLHGEFVKAMNQADIRERMAKMGASPSPLSPEAFAQFVERERQRYSVLVKRSGATID